MQALITQEEWEEYQKLKTTFAHELEIESAKSVETIIGALRRLKNEGRNVMPVADILATLEDDLEQVKRLESKRKQYAKAAR